MTGFLRLSIVMLALLLAAPAQAADYFTLQQIAPRTYAAVWAKSGGSNAGVVIGDDAVAVIDSFVDPAAARELLAAIHTLTPLPVRYVINTHYHIDHVAGNAVFHAAGALIVAHPNVARWQRTENLKFFGAHISDAMRQLIATLPEPDIETAGTLTLDLGGRSLTVRAYPGHTGGDLVVIVPDAHTVFCGDQFWDHMLPNMIDAHAGLQMQTLDALAALPGIVHFVPGHGAVGNRDDVKEFRAYLQTLYDLVSAQVTAHKSDTEIEAAVVPALKQRYGDWLAFAHFAEPDVRNMADELKGTKRYPGQGPVPIAKD